MCVYFGFAHACQSMFASIRFLKMAKRFDVVTVRAKSAKKRETSLIVFNVDSYDVIFPAHYTRLMAI